MNVSTPTISHDQTANPTGHAPGASTSKWFAEWKQKKSAALAPTVVPQAPPADDATAKCLMGGGK